MLVGSFIEAAIVVSLGGLGVAAIIKVEGALLSTASHTRSAFENNRMSSRWALSDLRGPECSPSLVRGLMLLRCKRPLKQEVYVFQIHAQ